MKVKFYTFIVGYFLSSFFVVFADNLQLFSTANCLAKNQHDRMSIRHIEKGGIGYNQGYTTIDGFFATRPQENKWMPFLDFRAHIFNNGKVATNVGAGARAMVNERIYGGNVYYDYRRFKSIDFNQIGVGLETLGARWDVRLNGYIPVGEQTCSPYSTEFSHFQEHYLMLLEKYQLVMTGANAELGVHCGNSRYFDFYAAAGPYYFHEKVGCNKNLWGGKVRLLAKFGQYWTLELSNSYDRIFKNRFQGQLTLTVPFGSGGEKQQEDARDICDVLFTRMVQPVDRQEIIVIDCKNQCSPAIDPETDQPYNFIFVNNQSNSLGTYESPYPTLLLAQTNSKIRDIIYVYPGDGTTRGMNAGMTLKKYQKFWGSGIDHTLVATQGTFIIPAETTSWPTMTNTADADGLVLASINEVSGFNITNIQENAIYGTNLENIEISKCVIDNVIFADQIHLEYSASSGVARLTDLVLKNGQGNGISINSTGSLMTSTIENCLFETTQVFSINASLAASNRINIMNSTFSNNTNGAFVQFNNSGSLYVSGNTFTGTKSESEVPLQVTAGSSPILATVTNNIISGNKKGALAFVLSDTNNAQLNISYNTITNNDSGSGDNLGSAVVISPNTTTEGNCTLNLMNNIFVSNARSALFCSNGSFSNFTVTARDNTITNNGRSGFVFDNGCDTLTLTATGNVITGGGDNGIVTSGGRTMTTANIVISDNQVTGSTGGGGIAFAHAGTTLNVTMNDNNFSDNDGSGILMYPAPAITNVVVDIERNTVNNNQNSGSNAAGGIDLEQFTNFVGTIANNTMLGNAQYGLYMSPGTATPNVCVTLTGNNTSTDANRGYFFDGSTGTFNLAPCLYESVNTGDFQEAGTITPVVSCPGAQSCIL